MLTSVLRIVTVLMLLAAPAWAEMRLVMIEEPGCAWCARWNEEIGPIYPKTDEGTAAPLMRLDISDARSSGITFDRRLSYTPTFVLIQNEAEVGRLEGYPGEDFFWPIVAGMIAAVAQEGEG